jgi:hypothetical protein
MQRHIHMHKNLQGAMLRMWRKWVAAHGNGRQIKRWRLNAKRFSSRLVAAKKSPHTTKRKENYLKFELLAESKCNQ